MERTAHTATVTTPAGNTKTVDLVATITELIGGSGDSWSHLLDVDQVAARLAGRHYDSAADLVGDEDVPESIWWHVMNGGPWWVEVDREPCREED